MGMAGRSVRYVNLDGKTAKAFPLTLRTILAGLEKSEEKEEIPEEPGCSQNKNMLALAR